MFAKTKLFRANKKEARNAGPVDDTAWADFEAIRLVLKTGSWRYWRGSLCNRAVRLFYQLGADQARRWAVRLSWVSQMPMSPADAKILQSRSNPVNGFKEATLALLHEMARARSVLFQPRFAVGMYK